MPEKEFKGESLRYFADMRFSNPAKLSGQLSLVDVYVCYDGKNRNGTELTKDAVNNALYSLYGVPIVGEWNSKDDGSGDFGSHGGKITITDDGMKYEETTKAYGFVTKEAAENAEWVTLTEKNGHTEHDYLYIKGCIVWTERFEELKNLLENNYGQSMEIKIVDAHHGEDGYLVIDSFEFSGLCILGSDVEPCFESAAIGRHYAKDEIGSDISALMSAYEEYQRTKGRDEKVDCFERLAQAVSDMNSEYGCDYALVDYICGKDGNGVAGLADCETFKTYNAEFSLAESDSTVTIKRDTLAESGIAVAGIKSDPDGFSLEKQADALKENIERTFAEAYSGKIAKLTEAYEKLKGENASMTEKLESYIAADKERQASEHIADVDAVFDRYAKKIGTAPQFLSYRAKCDYSLSTEEIEKTLKTMAGEVFMNETAAKYAKAKSGYSLSVADVSGIDPERKGGNDAMEARYGKEINDIIGNFMKG